MVSFFSCFKSKRSCGCEQKKVTLWHALLEKVTNFKCVGFLSVTEVKLKAYSRGHRYVINNLFH